MPRNRFYVVWQGRSPGIYSGWEECREQVEGFTGAKYMGFPTLELAEAAWQDDPAKYLSKELNVPKKIICRNPLVGEPDPDSICVDAACKGNPGILEYRGVDTKSGTELFRKTLGIIGMGQRVIGIHLQGTFISVNSIIARRSRGGWVRVINFTGLKVGLGFLDV